MSEPNDELSQRIELALTAEITRLWREATSATAATAVKYNHSAKSVQLYITFAEGTPDTEAFASVQRFLQLCNRTERLQAAVVSPNRIKKKRKRKASPSSASIPKSLPEALHLATPDTVRLLTLIPMIREGLHSLECRLAVSFRERRKLLLKGVVSRDLSVTKKELLEIQEVLQDLNPVVERFRIFDRLEAVLVEESASSYLGLAQDCLSIERTQDLRLGDLERRLERLAS